MPIWRERVASAGVVMGARSVCVAVTWIGSFVRAELALAEGIASWGGAEAAEEDVGSQPS